MSGFVSILVLVLSILMVDISFSITPAIATCDQLPRIKIPSEELLFGHTPYVYDYTLTPLFECTSNVNAKPGRGKTGYTGTSLNIQGNKVTPIQYTYSSDGKSLQAQFIHTGETKSFYSSASHFDDKGAFICFHHCNGTILTEFICCSNNNGISPLETQAVALARQLPNGNLIHSAKLNCPPSKGCHDFY